MYRNNPGQKLLAALLVFVVTLSLAPFTALAAYYVTISSGSHNNVYGNSNDNGASPTDSNSPDGNSLTISNATVTDTAYGSYIDGGASASDNTVTVNNGASITQVYGAHIETSISASATNNTVIINGGSVGVICGGCAISSTNANASASNNTVIINGGTVYGTIYGGISQNTSHNNTVTINGGTIGTSINLHGGYASSGTSANNTLNLCKTISANSVEYFQNYNFYLPAGFSAASDTMLSVNTTVDLTDCTVDLGFTSTPPSLSVGDEVTLINNVSNTPNNNDTAITASGYAFELSVSSGALIATVVGEPPPNPTGSGGFLVFTAPKAATTMSSPFPAMGEVVGRRINVYKLETLKSTLFRLTKGETFTILGIANSGRSLRIETNGSGGYIALKDIKSLFNAPIKAMALKKAGAYALNDSGNFKRIGYYDKNQMLNIYGISGKYLINRQANATYYLDAGQWKLALN